MSVNGETKTVMKGITHGACDYLIKPVRFEELKNIWQHVVRRRHDRRDRGSFGSEEDLDKLQNGNFEVGQGPTANESSDREARCSKKRKDHSDEEGFDSDENANENEDQSTQKKPRVVWSIELHRKFVAAVNLLGIEKAVPKRILDIMNVEKLTRENVASHLQKYRLYLKRLSAVASQQANIVAAFGARDPSYLHMSSVDGFGSFHSLAASGQLSAHTPFRTSAILGGTNSINLGFHSLSATGLVSHTERPSMPINDLSKFQPVNPPMNQNASLLQGIPMSFEPQLSQQRQMHEPNTKLAGSFSGSRLPICSSFRSSSNAPVISQTLEQQNMARGFGSNAQLALPSLTAETLQVTAGFCSPMFNISTHNDTLQGAVPFTGYAANALPMGSSTNLDDISMCTSIVAPPFQSELRMDDCRPDTSIIQTTNSKSFNFGLSGNSNQRSLETEHGHLNDDGSLFSFFSGSSLPNNVVADSVYGNQRIDKRPRNETIDRNMMPHGNANSSVITHNSRIDKSITDGLHKYKDDYTIGVVSSACSLNDLVSSMIKPERDETLILDSDICEFSPLGACM